MYYDFSWLLTTVVMSVIDFTIPTNLLAELPFDLTVTTWTATNVAWKLLKNLLRANLMVSFELGLKIWICCVLSEIDYF